MTATSSASAITGARTFFRYPLNPGMFSFHYAGGLIVPPNQNISITVSASLSIAGVLACFTNLTWWEG